MLNKLPQPERENHWDSCSSADSDSDVLGGAPDPLFPISPQGMSMPLVWQGPQFGGQALGHS